MEELKSNPNEVDWAMHIEKCEKSKVSMAKYCRENNLVYESMRFRKAERTKLKTLKPQLESTFVKVDPIQTRSAASKKIYPQPLPDAEWLARFLHSYVNCQK